MPGNAQLAAALACGSDPSKAGPPSAGFMGQPTPKRSRPSRRQTDWSLLAGERPELQLVNVSQLDGVFQVGFYHRCLRLQPAGLFVELQPTPSSVLFSSLAQTCPAAGPTLTSAGELAPVTPTLARGGCPGRDVGGRLPWRVFHPTLEPSSSFSGLGHLFVLCFHSLQYK